MVHCRFAAVLFILSPSFSLKCYQDESTTDLGEADGWDNYPFRCLKQAKACSITYNYKKRFMVRACQNTRCKTNGTETDKDMCTRVSANRLECCCYGSACNFITPDGILVPFIKKGGGI
ncbi:hypothetical protein AAVH_31973 [Aphelenchoides avenae]|nr:hypothetical protein AAVH_31973 [Aphelenchus avenae]